MDPSTACKIFFNVGSAVVIGGSFLPSIRGSIMNYGFRSSRSGSIVKESKYLTRLLDKLSSFQVPHAWFTHYYIVSVVSSAFWAHQIATHGWGFRLLAAHSRAIATPKMTANQVLLAWSMMAIQGSRRLLECLVITKHSEAPMWAGIWVIGILFYIFIGISVWIEGITAVDVPESPLSLVRLSKPSSKTLMGISLFFLASAAQNRCHKHLANLRKYTLPYHPLFRVIVCPHYTCECLVYLGIAVASAPPGQLANKTLMAALGFVASNLGVTADSTKQTYVSRFGIDIKRRWRMVPGIY